ncbi:MAG: arsenosugar biosynthesis radical SAM protein ArsS [Myxococcales bacterium]|nr:arsenosugar biosynthesis radical SAM protein ArsS [Myxococcales bacterium]
MSSGAAFKTTRLGSLRSRHLPLASSEYQLAELNRLPITRTFREALTPEGLWPLRPASIEILQINVGKLCNQTCRHCHVDAGPDRTEVMSRETAEQCVAALRRFAIPVVDITGGAPELNPSFRWLVEQCASLGRHVMDRCNLTILETGAHRDLPEFFAEHGVELICSLPHYQPNCTDTQRGDGVFEKSIRALRRLNALGYGVGRSGLRLVLVTNPVGAVLPPAQPCLEVEWKRELKERYDISFDALYTITNMPISRHLEWLLKTGNLEGYMRKLVESFNPQAAHGVMCRSTISVGWDGRLFDCDFNQMLDVPVADGAPRHIRDFDLEALEARTIVTDRHCFGCTAGAGSSCGGTTAS